MRRRAAAVASRSPAPACTACCAAEWICERWVQGKPRGRTAGRAGKEHCAVRASGRDQRRATVLDCAGTVGRCQRCHLLAAQPASQTSPVQVECPQRGQGAAGSPAWRSMSTTLTAKSPGPADSRRSTVARAARADSLTGSTAAWASGKPSRSNIRGASASSATGARTFAGTALASRARAAGGAQRVASCTRGTLITRAAAMRAGACARGATGHQQCRRTC